MKSILLAGLVSKFVSTATLSPIKVALFDSFLKNTIHVHLSTSNIVTRMAEHHNLTRLARGERGLRRRVYFADVSVSVRVSVGVCVRARACLHPRRRVKESQRVLKRFVGGERRGRKEKTC